MPNETQDYVWMQPPGGGDPEKVPAEEIGPRMFQGYRQVEAPAERVGPQPGVLGRLLGREGDK